MRSFTTILFLVLAAPAAADRQGDGASGVACRLRLRVSGALPVVSRPQTITARITPAVDVAGRLSVSFHCRIGQSVEQLAPDRSVELTGDAGELAVSQPWTPTVTGPCTLIVRVRLEQGAVAWRGPREATRAVTVVKRSLHFHYWDADPALEYITEGMVNEEGKLDDWADRGVIAQKWVGGRWAHDSAGKKTPRQLAEYWVAPYRQGWPGVVIDEFMAGGEVDEVLGRALIEARRIEPGIYLAPYTVAVGGEQKVPAAWPFPNPPLTTPPTPVDS